MDLMTIKLKTVIHEGYHEVKNCNTKVATQRQEFFSQLRVVIKIFNIDVLCRLSLKISLLKISYILNKNTYFRQSDIYISLNKMIGDDQQLKFQ